MYCPNKPREKKRLVFFWLKPLIANRSAFTLIELLIVIAIILMTIVFGVPAFNKYGNRAEVISTAEQIQATIEKAYANSNTPPKGANEIHLWMVYDSTSEDATSGKVLYTRGYKKAVVAPGLDAVETADEPGNTDPAANFPAEIVTIPSYMHLYYDTVGQSKEIVCNFKVAGEVACYDMNSTADPNPNLISTGNSLDMILTSEKTDLQNRINISNNPFRVRISDE